MTTRTSVTEHGRDRQGPSFPRLVSPSAPTISPHLTRTILLAACTQPGRALLSRSTDMHGASSTNDTASSTKAAARPFTPRTTADAQLLSPEGLDTIGSSTNTHNNGTDDSTNDSSGTRTDIGNSNSSGSGRPNSNRPKNTNDNAKNCHDRRRRGA
ncbi:hypothetical protein OIE67_35635 [Nonomuraea fuscirosea]|uniref:hypothetical protein n=1 Tax=Nonomuraea fuscirosea TaxID=1291556 RepID=UPI002DDA408A|nr:hypothetical protein [Nonomuraea fuscirosea]WSA49379.1 hypothetical protein OIE67_35635 [Nonomuraea fuscirosea]